MGLFVEKGEKLAFGALFLPSPVAANSPLRGENDHFSRDGSGLPHSWAIHQSL